VPKEKLIFNKSKVLFEKAYMGMCQRCKGTGIAPKDKDGKCVLCNGFGELWISSSGWTLAKWATPNKDEKLY